MSEPKHTPRHRWTSHYYRGGAEAAMREEAALKRAFQSFHGRANQFARATDEMALLEQEKAELLEALEGLADQAGSLLAELDYQQVSCPLCGEDLGDGDDALCRIVKALGETSDNARALIARLKGET